jgi:hypothetical protein
MYQELVNVDIERSQLAGFSHDMNEFFMVQVFENRTLHYVYFFFFIVLNFTPI